MVAMKISDDIVIEFGSKAVISKVHVRYCAEAIVSMLTSGDSVTGSITNRNASTSNNNSNEVSLTNLLDKRAIEIARLTMRHNASQLTEYMKRENQLNLT